VAAPTLLALPSAAPKLVDAKARHLHLLLELAADLAARVGTAGVPASLLSDAPHGSDLGSAAHQREDTPAKVFTQIPRVAGRTGEELCLHVGGQLVIRVSSSQRRRFSHSADSTTSLYEAHDLLYVRSLTRNDTRSSRSVADRKIALEPSIAGA
jgi:hypothetical protein